MRVLIAAAVSVLLSISASALETGKKLPALEISQNDGGLVDGTPFRSEDLKGKVTVIFYVDPDKKDLNEEFVERLKEEKFDRNHYRSVAIINMQATWMPNFAIEAALKSKQKKFPNAIYVKDKAKKGVEVWGVSDDDANIIVIDSDGIVRYVRSGKIPESEYETIFSLIRNEISKL